MKRLCYTLMLVTGFALTSIAQTQVRPPQASSEQAIFQEKVNAVKACEELHLQLTKLFGAGYSLKDAKVIKQLKANISNKEASRCIRKKSLYAIYGEDYINHLELINN